MSVLASRRNTNNTKKNEIMSWAFNIIIYHYCIAFKSLLPAK